MTTPAVLALVRRDDLISDVDSLSLVDFASGIALQDDGWQQVIADDGDTSVAEALTIIIRGSSPDDLAAKVRALDAKITQVYWYQDPQELYGVWLRVRLFGETNTRQALVLSAKRSPAPLWTGQIRNPLGGQFYLEQYGLALERMPFWESPDDLLYSNNANVNAIGGTWDYTTYPAIPADSIPASPGAVPGDAPARPAFIELLGDVGIGPLTKVWAGFRTNRFGNRANFVPVWKLHAAVTAFQVDADTTATADATAKDGTRTTTTFSTVATLLRRVTMAVRDADLAGNYNDQRGTFMALLRAKLSAGSSSVNARLADGYFRNPNMAVRPRVNIQSTSWQFYEMGNVQIPSPGRPQPNYDIGRYSLGIDAERISGSANLHLDCLVLIPINEGYFTTDQDVGGSAADGIGGAGGGNSQRIFEKPDGARQALYIDSAPVSNVVVRQTGGVPAGSGLLVVAAQRVSSSVKADTVEISLDVYPRWTTLRGSA